MGQVSHPSVTPLLILRSGPIDTPIFRDGEAKGLFSSEMTSQATCLKRMGKPDEVAKVLCFLLTDDASYVTGCTFEPLKPVSKTFN